MCTIHEIKITHPTKTVQKFIQENITLAIAENILFFSKIQEAPQCNETRLSTIQPSIDVRGIRNERCQ